MEVYVFRVGHRPERDKRVTTHCALAARAFGAKGMFYSGIKDEGLEESVAKAVARWGGTFEMKYVKQWKKFFQEWNGKIVHLTMYGEDYKKARTKMGGKLLIIVGGEKVPAEVYKLSNYNIAVTAQPHSEISALAVFMERLNLPVSFEKAVLRIIPQTEGKKVVTKIKKSS